MADQNRTATAPLISELLRNPHQFTFYQAVRLLIACNREAVPPGMTGPAAQEQLRFRPHASFAFPSSDVESIEEDQRRARPGVSIQDDRHVHRTLQFCVTLTGLLYRGADCR